jgi:hypothetical protein
MPLYVTQYAIQSLSPSEEEMAIGTRGSMTQLLERTTARHIHRILVRPS